jgi:hypothetical protein
MKSRPPISGFERPWRATGRCERAPGGMRLTACHTDFWKIPDLPSPITPDGASRRPTSSPRSEPATRVSLPDGRTGNTKTHEVTHNDRSQP